MWQDYRDCLKRKNNLDIQIMMLTLKRTQTYEHVRMASL
ncbi:MAG: hypothetical protein ACJAS9_003468 [Polaribacter sp.]|jgi:hypothetical protein